MKATGTGGSLRVRYQQAARSGHWSLEVLPTLPMMRFAIEATGRVMLGPGAYTLRTISDDGVRVWVDGRLTIEFEDHYVVQPSHAFWNRQDFLQAGSGKPCQDGFRYSSDTNPWWLTDDEIAKLVEMVVTDPAIDIMPLPTESTFLHGG